MKWTTIKSSNLNRIRYFKSTRLLLIEFKSGSIYAYGNVSWSVYMRFRRAESQGVYHARFLKDSDKYPCQPLSPTDVTRFELR